MIPLYQIKNKNMTQANMELILEMDILEQLRKENGVQEITIVSSVNSSVL